MKISDNNIGKIAYIRLTDNQLDSARDFSCAKSKSSDTFIEVESVLESEDTPKWLLELAMSADSQNIQWILGHN